MSISEQIFGKLTKDDGEKKNRNKTNIKDTNSYLCIYLIKTYKTITFQTGENCAVIYLPIMHIQNDCR